MLNIISFVLRGLQLIFGAIVLGLSIRAIQWQRNGSAPATTSYSAFAGAFCMLVALVGIAAVWIHKLAGLIMAGIDTLASILLVAGGIAFAVAMRGIDCGNLTTEINGEEAIIDGRSRGLISGGCREDSRANDEYVCAFGDKSTVEGRCQAIRADTAFCFLGFIACVAAAVVCLLQRRRGNQTARF